MARELLVFMGSRLLHPHAAKGSERLSLSSPCWMHVIKTDTTMQSCSQLKWVRLFTRESASAGRTSASTVIYGGINKDAHPHLLNSVVVSESTSFNKGEKNDLPDLAASHHSY